MITVKNLVKNYKSPVKGKNFLTDLFNRQYRETKAVDNISFEIGENELIGLIGPNGAGKTTTLKILSGILFPTSGEVKVLEFNPFEKNFGFLQQISFIMGQRNQLIWDLPAIETFNLNKEIYGITEKKYQQTVEELSTLLNCKDITDKPVKTLSLGERMKMELIAGLIHNPKIIFFDEPTIGLDIFSQEVIRDFIREYQKEFKATIILTSHYMEDVKRLAKRIIVINRGKILYDGLLKEIVKKYSQDKYVTVTLIEKTDQNKLSKVGKPVSFNFPRIKYKFHRKDLPEKINLINQTLPYSDLNIEEEPVEEIIKTLFRRK